MPMTNIEHVRQALAMHDAGYQWKIEFKYVEALLEAYETMRNNPHHSPPAATTGDIPPGSCPPASAAMGLGAGGEAAAGSSEPS
jgi:hypothetical protein